MLNSTAVDILKSAALVLTLPTVSKVSSRQPDVRRTKIALSRGLYLLRHYSKEAQEFSARAATAERNRKKGKEVITRTRTPSFSLPLESRLCLANFLFVSTTAKHVAKSFESGPFRGGGGGRYWLRHIEASQTRHRPRQT